MCLSSSQTSAPQELGTRPGLQTITQYRPVEWRLKEHAKAQTRNTNFAVRGGRWVNKQKACWRILNEKKKNFFLSHNKVPNATVKLSRLPPKHETKGEYNLKKPMVYFSMRPNIEKPPVAPDTRALE